VQRRALPLAGALLASACGGGGTPTGPSATPSPPAGHEVAVVVYYDENDNGVLDGRERTRIPYATVEIGGRSGRTQKGTGRALVAGVPAGSHTVTIRAGTLPPFYTAAGAAAVTVPPPAGSEVLLAVRLPIGDNRANTYMAFGDSISVGVGSSDGTGYRSRLDALLQESLSDGIVLNRGGEGTRSSEGAERISRGLRALKPAYTLTLYGTNDWNDPRCQAAAPCFTVDSLREIVRTVQYARSLPLLATIIPGNPTAPQVPAERNAWLRRTNELIRVMAREEGAVLVDLEAAFLRQADMPSLFADHVHPNDRGYALIAEEWFKAIAPDRASSSSPFFAALAPAGPPALLARPRPRRASSS